MPLQQTVRRESDVTIVEVVGKMIVGEGSTTVLDSVHEALGHGERKIVLDLSKVTRLDSSGIGELTAAHNATQAAGGNLKLSGLSPKLASVLQITQLIGVLDSYDDEAQAVSSFAG